MSEGQLPFLMDIPIAEVREAVSSRYGIDGELQPLCSERDQMRELAKTQPLIGDVRGHGMLGGLEFITDHESRSPATEETSKLLELMRERRVLVGSEGRDSNTLKLRPPLVFERRHVDLFIAALDASLTELR